MARNWIVCPECRGNGAVALHGYDVTEQVAEDPDFAEDYAAGRYDTACTECDGKRVVPGCSTYGCDEETAEDEETCYDHADEETREKITERWENRAEEAAERRHFGG